MQRTYYKIKSQQFSKWYKELCKTKLLGEKNLETFREWRDFNHVFQLLKKKNFIPFQVN